jgi:hypothetical protein
MVDAGDIVGRLFLCNRDTMNRLKGDMIIMLAIAIILGFAVATWLCFNGGR